MTDEHPTQTLYAQLDWAMKTFLHKIGVVSEKPPAEPPRSEAQAAKRAEDELARVWRAQHPRKKGRGI